MAKLIENNYTNPLTSDVEAIDAAGLDYGAYDKNNYFLDFLQDIWGYAFGGDSNWGDSQRVENRSKAEDYAKQFFDDNTGTYELGTDDYKVADNIRKMYDVDESKGIGFLTGAANWVGDQIYDNATKSDESRKILRQLMQGGTTFDMEDNDGNAVTYNLGKDIYDAILNDDYEYVDDVLRTVGSDLSKAGKTWDELDADTMRDLGLNYNIELARTNGNYDLNREAAEKGQSSPITLGNREGSEKFPIFNENGKYNALAGNNNAANILDAADIISTAVGTFIPGVGLARSVAKGAGFGAKAANNAANAVPNTLNQVAKSKIGQNISNIVNDVKQNSNIRKMQKSYSRAEKNASNAKTASNDNKDLSLYNSDTAKKIIEEIGSGKAFNPVNESEKATLNILKGSKIPGSKSKIIEGAKNAAKFMANPKNIYLGNSITDVATTPIEAQRRLSQNGSGSYRDNGSTMKIDPYTSLRIDQS